MANRDGPHSSGNGSTEPGANPSIEERLQKERTTVFKDESLLDPTRIVDEDRIYGRDEQLNEVIRLLQPALEDVAPKDMLLHGPSGTGKSLILRTVANKLVNIGQRQGHTITFIEINCGNIRTEDGAVYRIVDRLTDRLDIDTGISKKGVSTADKYERLFEVINDNLDLAIIILDELDLLVGRNHTKNQNPAFSDLLYNLTRANDIGDVSNDIAIATLTNDAESLIGNLDSRTASSFKPREVLFDDYNPEELRQILHRREDAFRNGVLTDDVIPHTAAYAAQGEGDARQAIDLLRAAGEIADKKGASQVTKEHTNQAQTKVETEYTLSIIRNASIQKQTIVFAAANCAFYNDTDIEGVPGQIAHTVYERMADYVELDVRKRDSTRDWLHEYVTHSLLEMERIGYGQGAGWHTHYYFTKPPETVIRALEEANNRLDEVAEETEVIRNLVKKEYNNFPS